MSVSDSRPQVLIVGPSQQLLVSPTDFQQSPGPYTEMWPQAPQKAMPQSLSSPVSQGFLSPVRKRDTEGGSVVKATQLSVSDPDQKPTGLDEVTADPGGESLPLS
jgi:hypothetical protein